MKVSVIIPTFQEGKFLRACIESIRRQTAGSAPLEIIVADAASTDETQSIARTMADKLVVTTARGIALGRNAGAMEATGDLVVFIDADVVLDDNVLRDILGAFQDPALIGATAVGVPQDGGPWARAVYVGTYVLVRLFHVFGLSLFPGICVAYRANAFRSIGGFREDLAVSEDIDLSRRIRRLGRTRVLGTAKAFVSTRRLQKNGLSVVLFHVYHHIRYLLTGASARRYPKTEETSHWTDIWRTR